MKIIKFRGNKVTPEDVVNAIIKEKVKYVQLGEKITVCHLTLVDGFEVIGKSGVVDPANFQFEIGKRVAYDHAVSEVWGHLGSLLQAKLTAVAIVNAEIADLREKGIGNI